MSRQVLDERDDRLGDLVRILDVRMVSRAVEQEQLGAEPVHDPVRFGDRVRPSPRRRFP